MNKSILLPLYWRLLIVPACFCLPLQAQERTTFTPPDSGAALLNPAMGWVLHYYDNSLENYGHKLEPSDTVDDFPGLSVVYLRLAWAYLEPEEGKFNWALVDTPAQRWIARGKKIAFRFSCSETDEALPFATPEWVKKAGAKGHYFTPGKGVDPQGKFWDPDFDDPVFLAKLDRFLGAAAARYDGDPNVAFIDVGSFGVWGEGHTFWSTKLAYSSATVRRHVDLYLKHFKKTLLTANDDFKDQGRGMDAIQYPFSRGLTLRDDSIMVQPKDLAFLSASLAEGIWQNRGVVLESEHYGPSKERGAWEDGRKYLEALEAYHASYVSIHWFPREFLEANRELIRRMNLRLGYRLQLEQISYTAKVTGQTIQLNYAWRNAGVAPCYPGGFPSVTLKDAKGGIALSTTDETLDVRNLPVDLPGKAKSISGQMRVVLPPQLKPGLYTVWVSVGSRQGTPALALPLSDNDGQHRYKAGTIAVQ